MSKHMRRYNKFIRMTFVVIVHYPLHCVFHMSRHFGLSVLVQKEKTCVSADNDFHLG